MRKFLATKSILAVCAFALGSGVSLAQRQDGAATAADAISDAVQEGHNPYRPEPAAPQSGNVNSAECQELLREYNATPKREYQATGPSITTSQGRVVQGLERDRSRKDLEETYKAKCAH